MIRILFLLAALGVLASCTQYQEPQVNCFTFLASSFVFIPPLARPIRRPCPPF